MWVEGYGEGQWGRLTALLQLQTFIDDSAHTIRKMLGHIGMPRARAIVELRKLSLLYRLNCTRTMKRCVFGQLT